MTVDPHRDQPVFRSGTPLGEASGAMILVHGRGASATDFLTFADELDLRSFAYLAPQAANHTWYPRSFLSRLEENEPFLSSALRKIESTMQLAIAAGVTKDRIIVIGFSQGACLATEFVARNPLRYAGLISFTGGLIGSLDAEITHEGNLAGTPVFLASGDPDAHVPWQRVQYSANVLKTMCADVTVRRYPGIAHTVTPEEIEVAQRLILDRFR